MLSTVPSTKDRISATASTRERSLSQNNYNKPVEKGMNHPSRDIINKVETVDDNESTTEKMVNSFNELMYRPSIDYNNSQKYQSKSNIGEKSPDIFRVPPNLASATVIKPDDLSGDLPKDLQEIKESSGQALVNIDKKDNRFNFYDKLQVYLGSFSIDELMKYIAHKYDPKNQFLPSINQQRYNEAINIINKMIGSVKYNKNLKYAYIDLLNYDDSPFMGNINSLVKLNNMLHNFEKDKLENALALVDDEYAKKIRQFVKKFIYIMLNYTLQLISITSEAIKNENTREALKKELMNYSIGIVFRISQYVQDQLRMLTDKADEIEKIVNLNIKTTQALENKIDNLESQYNTINTFNTVNVQNGGLSLPPDNEGLVVSYSPYDIMRSPIESDSDDSTEREEDDDEDRDDEDDEDEDKRSLKTFSSTSDSNYSAIENYEI